MTQKWMSLTQVFYTESINGRELVQVEFVDRSWLKCRPVGKGNENDIAPEAEKGSRAFRVV